MKGSGSGFTLIVDCLLVSWPRSVRHDPAHFLRLVNRDFSAADADVMTYVPAWEGVCFWRYSWWPLLMGPDCGRLAHCWRGRCAQQGAQPRMAAISSTGPAQIHNHPGMAGACAQDGSTVSGGRGAARHASAATAATIRTAARPASHQPRMSFSARAVSANRLVAAPMPL